ncbi:hypothetical protein COCOBI_05-2610 [Coccomyxa sp. Obi]|nr:hypothetical protein COCOBI_05-2610 [Coccomyxa sp. Obi]
MVSSYVGSVTQQLSPRQLHLSQSWPLITPSQGCAGQPERGSSCEYEVPLPYSAADQTWDISLDPIWKITAALKGTRQDSSATAATTTTSMSTPTSAPLSPLAQRAADAAVRAAAGWLSPGQWRSAQASSCCSSPGKAASQLRGSSAAAAQVAQRQAQVSEDGLVVFRPRRWLAGGASDLESSITALADALGVLQGDAYSEAFPPPAAQLSRPAEASALSWHAPQPRYQPPLYDERLSGSADDWDDGDDSVDGELGRSGDMCEEPAPLQLQRSCSSDFFSACSDSLSASEERCPSAESSPTQLSPPQLQIPLSAVPANTIRHNTFSQFPATAAFKSDSTPPQAEEPASAKCSPPLPNTQVPALSPFAMATARGASEGPGLRTPFATACLASPFEAPSPRDMHLSPAEERLVPTPSLVGRAGAAAGDAVEGESPRETAERERASRMLACLWANTEKAPWAEEAAAEPREAKISKPARPATPPSCAAQQKSSGGGAMGKRLFGIVGDNQSEWQPLVRESNQVMELAGLDTEWLLHDLLVFADAVYA